MAELVDAVDSKSTGRKALGVRFPLPVPEEFQGVMLTFKGWGCVLFFCQMSGGPGIVPDDQINQRLRETAWMNWA